MSSEGQAASPADARQDGSASDAPRPSDDPRALREEIERTREQLGATVEALAAKADVKAQAQQKVSQLTERLTTKAAQAQRQLADKTAKPRRKVFALIGPAKDQVSQRAAEAATSVSKVTPEPVKQAAGKAAGTARRRRGPLAAAGAVGAAVLGWLLINRWRRR
jgi:hypothetical protein